MTSTLRSCILKFLRRTTALALPVVPVLAISTPPAQGQTYTVLFDFGGKHGISPSAGLIGDANGNLYSTTQTGGTSGNCINRCGTVFRLDRNGKEKVLYSFTGGTDGGIPSAGLIQDAAGFLYGTTGAGGNADNGTVFRVDKTGKEKVLYMFTGGLDGDGPKGGLSRDAAGNLYGTTVGGGVSNWGTVFKLDTTGKETVLYSFTGGTDGGSPLTNLVRDAAGNLFGTTSSGGIVNSSCNGCGTVFKVDPNGTETVVYAFRGPPDGASPFAGLIRDAQGNFYGTTFSGGSGPCFSNSGCGTVFKLDKTGKETVLYSFTGGSDGFNPVTRVLRDSSGNLYGTTFFGGGDGTVFKLDPSGTLTVLHNFSGGTDGGSPAGELLRDAAGNLYGTASSGGRLLCTGGDTFGCGVVFKIAPN